MSIQKNSEETYEIIQLDGRFRRQVDAVLLEKWAGPVIISRGREIDTSKCPGFVAVRGDELLGIITYRVEEGECEIVSLDSLQERIGIGSNLVRAVRKEAKKAACKRLFLITTNDNIHGIRFYQVFGFSLAAVHLNALDRSRELKPGIPLLGLDGIPIQHEFEFEIVLGR